MDGAEYYTLFSIMISWLWWAIFCEKEFLRIIDWEFIQGIEYKNGISIGSMTIRSQDMFSSIFFLIILFILKINQWWCCSITSPEIFVFGFLCYLLNCSDSNINSEWKSNSYHILMPPINKIATWWSHIVSIYDSTVCFQNWVPMVHKLLNLFVIIYWNQKCGPIE